MSIKKIIIGGFVGILMTALISSTYFYNFFKKSIKKIDKGLDKWDEF